MTPTGGARLPALVLIHHGHSDWSLSHRLTGWTDISLTQVGLDEARAAGRRLAAAGYAFDEAHPSTLARCRQTAEAMLEALRTPQAPIHASWWLNERHYGQLQGMTRPQIPARWGEVQARHWWRGYFDRPPELEANDLRRPRVQPAPPPPRPGPATRGREPAGLPAAHPALLAGGVAATPRRRPASADDQPWQHPARTGH